MKKIYYLLLLFVIPFLGFIFSGNASAVSDLVYTFSGNNLGANICGTNVNLEDCQSFNYLYVEVINPDEDNLTSATMYISPNGQSKPYPVTNILMLMPSNYSRIYFGVGTPFNFPSVSFKVTLSENNPAGGITPSGDLSIVANGTYDVTNYATATVDIDSDSSAYVQIVIDAFWRYCIAFAGVIVSVIIIAFLFKYLRKVFK